jgi:hypothetical protein
MLAFPQNLEKVIWEEVNQRVSLVLPVMKRMKIPLTPLLLFVFSSSNDDELIFSLLVCFRAREEETVRKVREKVA